VLHNQAARIDDMTMRITSWDTGAQWRRVAASSNPSFKRKTNGRPGCSPLSFLLQPGLPSVSA